MISLRNFVTEDAEILKKNKYRNMSLDEIRMLITRWNTGNYRGNYFVVFAIIFEGKLAGMISLYQHTESIVSIGPEVFTEYRDRGFSKSAMEIVMKMAKDTGYKIISQQIRTDNSASISLHKSLGFETDGYLYTNRQGKKVLVYLKALI